MSEYLQNFNHLIEIYIQCTIQNSQTSERFCCPLYQGQAETSCSRDGQSQTHHTRNDESGINPQRDSCPTKEGHEQDGLLRCPSNKPNDRPKRLSPQHSQRDLDEETLVDTMTRSRQEAKHWEWSENDTAKCHRKALDHVIQAAEEAVENAKNNNLSRQECSNYRVKIGAVGIKNLEDLTNRNSSVTVRTLRRENASRCLNLHIPCFHPLLQLRSACISECTRCV